MFEHVPQRMRDFAQWIVWRHENVNGRATKVPYTADDSPRRADITDAACWRSFDEAVRIYHKYGMSPDKGGIGFCFGGQAGLVGVDLDKCLNGTILDQRFTQLIEAFDSYTELSPSGEGLHIIVEGELIGGRRRGQIEMYGSQRFFTVTGNPYRNTRIVNKQDIIAELWRDLGGTAANRNYVAEYASDDADRTDEDVYAQCLNSYPDKFERLWNGDWQTDYKSQSEADQALVNYLTYWSNFPDQIVGMFRASGLGQRQKAQRNDYVSKMVNKSFDKHGERNALARMVGALTITSAPVSNFRASNIDESLSISNNAPIAPAWAGTGPTAAIPPAPQQPHAPAADAFSQPPGMVGEIAEFIYRQAKYPMPSAACLAALAFLAGICGRQYQVEGTGLNMYLMLIARTGSGKEAMTSGITQLFNAVCDPKGALPGQTGVDVGFPAGRIFRGPADVTGRGVQKSLVDCDAHSQIVIINEFHYKLHAMVEKNRPNAGDAQLKKTLLDFYNKSGFRDTYEGSKSADKEKDVSRIVSPALTVLGESTEKFYDLLDEDLVHTGLLPRMVVVYSRPPAPHEHNANSAYERPSDELVRKIRTLMARIFELIKASDMRITVKFDEQAARLSEEFRVYARTQAFANDRETVENDLWNRAHQNTLRVAALLAVGMNIDDPMITADLFVWAKNFIVYSVTHILGKFERHEVGTTSDMTKISAVRTFCAEFFGDVGKKQFAEFGRYAGAGLVPQSYMLRRANNMKPFKEDRRGAAAALRDTLNTMIDTGELVFVDKLTIDGVNKSLWEAIGIRGRAYKKV